MKVPTMMLLALAATVAATSVAAAESKRVTQRVAISAKNLANGQFVLTPLQSGTLKRDSGKASITFRDAGKVMHQGQSVSLYESTFIFKGERGSLTINERSEWVDVSNENAPGFDFRPAVAIGTWKVVRGTAQYALIAGGGRSAHAGMGQKWFARQEGFVRLR
jgi:hypothetical protein